ncbi:hypothetical protein P775_00545 [Puniceibacterium antarcticum]|uniref:MobA/VirD2-like nuclease domain-containing protein n=1 Tax=Puniceibacterium antarcticum TaxID=1206336 RepID=A0A2G8RLP3_9RHOB|nr:relaxase/mobilization nuclease domain-containing protein [Puniceibacterium antarcticum]PIL22188.1 hypothetical protein P775_00545 [Puniceibacterium antarcticum]
MSEFKTTLGFQDCWLPRTSRTVTAPASGSFGVSDGAPQDSDGPKASNGGGGSRSSHAASISAADKARLARVVKGTPEVMVKVSRPAKNDKSGNPIKVTRATEALRVSEHLAYISRNGKLDVENDRGEVFTGGQEVAAIYREWMNSHDEDRDNHRATDRTRISTSMMFSMPAHVNGEAVKDAVRALGEQEFKGRHDYVMALHTDTQHPHVHLTVRTIGQDGERLNLRKADLQHLRDTFAEKLRQRGIEAEATPRHARGKTRKGEATPVYKIRQRGRRPLADARKERQVQRELKDNAGRLAQKPWDDALVARRNRVMTTYGNAARVLAASDDPADRELADATQRFTARLTDTTTQRLQMAQSLDQGGQGWAQPSRDGKDRGDSRPEVSWERERGSGKDRER